ncbi:hypothetical protein OJ998_32990 [Solirubrobacter taibaiensis]|nr:hypothetical protein [Solirubrobacter taibaiensis]
MPSAQALLAARARRVTAIRQRVIAATLASFVLFWGAVAWDGSMGPDTSTAAQASETTTEQSTTESTDTYSDDTTSYQDDSTSSDDGSSLSTSQS